MRKNINDTSHIVNEMDFKILQTCPIWGEKNHPDLKWIDWKVAYLQKFIIIYYYMQG
jgi:hypothetical protein